MTVTVKTLIPSKQVAAAQTTQFTAEAKTIIDKLTVTNTTANSVTFSLNLIPLGESASASNTIISSKEIAPGETYTCPEVVGHSLEAGGVISTLAGTASALTIRASGREIT